MNELKIKKGFTLVELIIVITILVILATIAFVSFQNHTKDARDSNRLMTIKNIQNGLEGFQIKTGFYPEPENFTNITASSSIISKQGYFGESQSDIINIDKLPLDPLDGTKYIYSINSNKNKYQLLSYLEANSQLSFINETYADDLTKRNIKSFGNDLGIILNQDKTNITGTGFDILSNTGNIYSLIFTDNNITLSGSEIFTNVYNKREDLLRDETLAYLDNSLVGYWNMETVCKDGSCGSGNDGKLKDLSKYLNHGTCYNGTSSGTCGIVGPKIVDGNGKSGKAMNFDGIDDYIESKVSGLGNDYTILTKIKTNSHSGFQVILGPYANSDDNRFGLNSLKMIVSICESSDTNHRDYYSNSSINTDYNYIISSIKDNSINIYKNGYLDVKHTDNKIRALINGDISIGRRGWPYSIIINGYPSLSFNGIIDEIRIYNRALSDEEIKKLYSTFK